MEPRQSVGILSRAVGCSSCDVSRGLREAVPFFLRQPLSREEPQPRAIQFTCGLDKSLYRLRRVTELTTDKRELGIEWRLRLSDHCQQTVSDFCRDDPIREHGNAEPGTHHSLDQVGAVETHGHSRFKPVVRKIAIDGLLHTRTLAKQNKWEFFQFREVWPATGASNMRN